MRVLIAYLFFLPVMLPSVLPRLGTDSAVRRFPGVWKLLSLFFLILNFILFLKLYIIVLVLPNIKMNPPQVYMSIFFPTSFRRLGLLFWVPDVLCRHSEVVLWNLLSI